jgi:hypothetical protein
VSARGEIWLGPIELLDGRWRDRDLPPCLVATASTAEPAARRNTISLELGDLSVSVRPTGSRRPAAGPLRFGDLYDGLTPSPALRALLADVLPANRMPLVDSYVPIFYRDVLADERGHVYGRARFYGDDALFIRTSEEQISATDDETVLRAACDLHAHNPTFINSHQCYYRRCLAGKEAEYKFTLPAGANIWALTASFHDTVKRGGLPGYVLEYRDEFQTWDYVNHLFEVLAPEPERGYVSFIPTTDGRYTRKRKWYVQDALTRREEISSGISIEGSIEEYLRDYFDAETRQLPSFRRVRYDVNFESIETGHVYGAFFDHCSLLEAPEVALVQCELEYLRSRTMLRPDEGAVLPELGALAERTRTFLGARRQPFHESFYSKLSFLRDVVDGTARESGPGR